MKGFLKKEEHDIFICEGTETESWAQKIPVGDVVSVEMKKVRNYKFLKKFFSLLEVGFDAFEPTEVINQYGVPEKNKDQFREDITILAGFYEQRYRIDGTVRVVAKSIAFDKMEADEFEKLYNAVANAILKHVLVNYKKADLDDVVDRVMNF